MLFHVRVKTENVNNLCTGSRMLAWFGLVTKKRKRWIRGVPPKKGARIISWFSFYHFYLLGAHSSERYTHVQSNRWIKTRRA